MECPVCKSGIVEDAAFCPRCNARIEGVPEREDYEYEAFISYRHLPLERGVAVKLQKTLEGLVVPKGLRKKVGKRKLGKCFRDEDELPTTGTLSEQIEEALRQSRYLVVVCSPRTRESLWVLREVELFASYHGRDRVLVALAEGEPDESFPELLLSRLEAQEDGSISEVAVEPIAADFRDPARKRFRAESQRVAAALLGCDYDDLRQRMRARRARMAAAIASGVAAVSIVFGGVMFYQQAQIRENYRQIQISESEFLANESAELLAQGDRYQAIQVALAALPESSTSDDRPFVPAAQMALENALYVYPSQSYWHSCYSEADLKYDSDQVATFNDTGLQATVVANGEIEISEIETDTVVTRIDAQALISAEVPAGALKTYDVAVKFAGERLIVVYPEAIGCFDAREGTLDWTVLNDEGTQRAFWPDDYAMAVSPDGETLAVFTWTYGETLEWETLLIDVSEGHIVGEFELSEDDLIEGSVADFINYCNNPSFSPDGRFLAFAYGDSLIQINLENHAISHRKLRYPFVGSVKYMGGYLTAISKEADGCKDGMAISLEVFDDGLELVWDKSENYTKYYNVISDGYSFKLGVCALWNYYGGDDQQFVVLFGDKMLFLDVGTGEEAFRITCDSGFLDCAVMESAGTRLFFCTSAGEVACRVPRESNEGLSGILDDYDLGTGLLFTAKFTQVGDQVYLSAQNSTTNKRCVFKHTPEPDVANTRFLDDNQEEWKTFIVDPSQVVITLETGILFLDPLTLETRVKIHYCDIDGIDLEKAKSAKFELSDNADLYCLFQMLPEEGVDIASYGLYRVGGESASVEKLLQIEGDIDPNIFKVYDYVPNAPTVLMVEDIGKMEKIILFEPETGAAKGDWVDRQKFPMYGLEGAWYTGEKVIAYARGIPYDNRLFGIKATEPLRFFLVDPGEGKGVDSDLSSYALRSGDNLERHTTLSRDGTLFAAACSDGVVRMFDANTGALLWEAEDVPENAQFLTMTAEGDLFIQDRLGMCMLVSGETGEVLQANTVQIPPLYAAATRDDNTLMALFAEWSTELKMGIAIIKLDQDSFGPLSVMYNCWVVTADDSLYVFDSVYTGERLIADRLSLDELIEKGHETVKGHELTDAEKHLYRVED